MASIGAAAFDAFMNARGMVVFYMFILEEAAQTAGMAAYLAYKDGNGSEAAAHAQWVKDNVITDGRAFAQTVGLVGAPMNDAFITFFNASERAMNYYATHTPAGE